MAISRVLSFSIYYVLPVVIGLATVVIWVRTAFDDGAASGGAAALAFFIPVAWGSIILTVYGDPIREHLEGAWSDVFLVAAGIVGVLAGGLVAFKSGTPLLQMAFLGVALGASFTVRASDDHDGLIERIFREANRQTLLVLGSVVTGVGVLGIIGAGGAS